MPHAAAPLLERNRAAPDTDVRRFWSVAFRTLRVETERRAAPLSAEDQNVQSMPDASPAKWHRAHTTWFFENFLLKPHAKDYREFDPRFGYLFNSYYVAAGPRHARPERGMITSTAQLTGFSSTQMPRHSTQSFRSSRSACIMSSSIRS
jgi:hypothetical protein